mgnify:CR=1 FL=1
MKSLEYVKNNFDEFEKDNFLDRRFTKRFINYLPTVEWKNFGFEYVGNDPFTPKEWTEENIMEDLKRDTLFGYEKAICERGISSELMAIVVNAWCKVLENGLDLNGNDGCYHIKQFITVAEHYGWKLEY